MPLAILALALVTAAVAASSAATRAEIIANQGVRAQDKAYQMAEAGLQLFLLRRSDPAFGCQHCVADPTVVIDSEWTQVSLVGGYADVVAHQVRAKINDTIPALFFIKSHGVDTTAKMSGTGLAVYAERTVGQYATFATPIVKVRSPITSLYGLRNSTTGIITGQDACSGTRINGVTVGAGGHYSLTGFGSPPIGTPKSIDTNSTASAVSIDSAGKRAGIDWNGIINNEAIPTDYLETTPSAAWFAANPTSWPVIHFKNNATVAVTGRGMLIAEKKLALSGDWRGIILVGDSVNVSSTGGVIGAIISGLNLTLAGASFPANNTTGDRVRSSADVTYNSCDVSSAASKLQYYFAWSNTWLDNVAVW